MNAELFEMSIWVRLHQPFSRTLFAFFFPLRFCKFECNPTSDWLNRMVISQSEVVLIKKKKKKKPGEQDKEFS